MTPPKPPRPAPREVAPRTATAIGLVAMSAAFAVLAAHYVPHLSNSMWADQEFTGWSAALARRMVHGELPYRDLVLPMPPGSMWLLVLVQRWAGRAAALHEVAVGAVCHLAMAWLAWCIARPLLSRLGALLVAAATLATVIQLPKELAYDHTAQVCAWSSFALVVQALVAPRARLGWAAAGGVAAGLVLFFKQSTMAGAVLGGGLALLLDALFARAEAPGPRLRALAPVLVFALAAVVGVALALGLVAATGSPVREMLRLVFVEGSKLKGGLPVLVGRLSGYFVIAPTVQLPLLTAAVALAVALRLARSQTLALGDDDPQRSQPVTRRQLGAFVAIVSGAAALGVALLRSRLPAVPAPLGLDALAAQSLPPVGLLVGVAYAIAAVRARGGASRRARWLAALLPAALVQSAFHNASVPEVRIFYDNNTIVPVSLVALFLALEQARAERWRWAAFAVIALAADGGKMERWLEARTLVKGDGFWGGMLVPDRGVEALKAARRADELAGPDGTVLVLPEDLSFAALVESPRPKLCGAILFVDQYPERCFGSDLASLEANLPKVIVLYPRWTNEWRRMYEIWNARSPAGLVNRALIDFHLPRSYRRDSSYEAVYWGGEDHIDVYVRDDAERPADVAPQEGP